MIQVDERVGSRELLSGIRNLGIEAELSGNLESDFQFIGNGPDNETILVGIERKTITDLIQSMRDNRLAGQQVGRMVATYDRRYLIVEGIWRLNRDNGYVECPAGAKGWRVVRGAVKYQELDRFLCSLGEFADMQIWRTNTEDETCRAIADRYIWWQKQYHEHRTAKTVYSNEVKRKGRRGLIFKEKSSLLEKWLCQLNGIDGRTVELAKWFESPLALAQADVTDWMTIKGLKIGRKTAEKIVAEIRNRTTHA